MLRYKACKNSIVTLELLEDTKNNEKRDGIVDDKYAKFRCDRAKVISIVNVKTGKTMENDNSIIRMKFIYSLGEIVKTNFDPDLNEICASGIHYFKTREAAVVWFYRQNDEKFPDGNWISWRENGQKFTEGTYKNGKAHGKCIGWRGNGQKLSEGTYKNGKKHGKCIQFDVDGNKFFEGTFKDGKKDGKRTEWWSNGNKRSEGMYKDGEKYGEWAYWCNTGQEIDHKKN